MQSNSEEWDEILLPQLSSSLDMYFGLQCFHLFLAVCYGNWRENRGGKKTPNTPVMLISEDLSQRFCVLLICSLTSLYRTGFLPASRHFLQTAN